MNETKGLTLEAGKYYRTRDGRKAVVIGCSPFASTNSNYRVAGFIEDFSIGAAWKTDGKWGDGLDNRDLVAEWVEPKRIKGWVNIRLVDGRFNFGMLHATHGEALKLIDAREPVLACIEIDVLEGEGLNGEAA